MIDRYFKRFPGIRNYIDKHASLRAKGLRDTCSDANAVPDQVKARTPSARAPNAPRSTRRSREHERRHHQARHGADDESAAERRASVRMLLQVHDELVFEVPDDEVKKTMPVVKKVMEDAPHPAVSLHVPLQVDARAADNWDEAHSEAALCRACAIAGAAAGPRRPCPRRRADGLALGAAVRRHTSSFFPTTSKWFGGMKKGSSANGSTV